MKSFIYALTFFAVVGSAGAASACALAPDPSYCRALRHCQDQGWLKPFCYMGKTNDGAGART